MMFCELSYCDPIVNYLQKKEDNVMNEELCCYNAIDL